MQLKILASGSTANAYLLTAGGSSLLLDAGLPWKRLLEGVEFSTAGIDACLLSHSHKDHSKAINEVMAAGIPVYTSSGTAEAIGAQVHNIRPVRPKEPFSVGNWMVTPIDTQHDAIEPLGFLIVYKPTGEKIIYATDTYFLKYSFPGVNYWCIEANYCTDRLMTQYESGEIETGLYRRLLQSHMSLEHLKDYLGMQDLRKARKIVLLHLSDARGDEKRMEQEIFELTKIDTVAARAGLTVDLKLCPF